MIDAVFWIGILVAGILLMTFSSDKAVEHSIIFASALGVSPLIIGLTLVSIGTDLPEIVNSIISCSLGHGNIDAGDSMGSVLTQLTLVFGLIALFSSSFKVKRRDIIAMGACLILSLMLVISIVEKGYISRINALFLVGSCPVYMLIMNAITGKTIRKNPEQQMTGSKTYHTTIAALGFVGVAIGAYAVVQSVIVLSEAFSIPEYLISFFLVAIGTSLPELVVDLTAIRRGQREIAIGDIFGSCIVDASLSIGIGQVFFPQAVSAELASTTILYTLFASAAVISILAVRERVDEKAGTIFIALYLLSYVLLVT